MENQILIMISLIIGFFLGRWKGSTDEVAQGVKKNVEGVFEGIRRVRYEKKMAKQMDKEPIKSSPWA